MQHSKKSKETFVSISNGKVEAGYTYFYRKEGNMYSVIIPAFRLAYSCNSEEEMSRENKAMIQAFVNYWLKDLGPKKFIIQLNALGFRTADHAITMKRLLHGETKRAKFKAPVPMMQPDMQEAFAEIAA